MLLCGTGLGMACGGEPPRPRARRGGLDRRSGPAVARRHNDANVLVLAGAAHHRSRKAGKSCAPGSTTAFDGGRHGRRVSEDRTLKETACRSTTTLHCAPPIPRSPG